MEARLYFPTPNEETILVDIPATVIETPNSWPLATLVAVVRDGWVERAWLDSLGGAIEVTEFVAALADLFRSPERGAVAAAKFLRPALYAGYWGVVADLEE